MSRHASRLFALATLTATVLVGCVVRTVGPGPEPVYYESGSRGFLEVHVTGEGPQLVNGIYAGFEAGVLTMEVMPTGRMTVR